MAAKLVPQNAPNAQLLMSLVKSNAQPVMKDTSCMKALAQLLALSISSEMSQIKSVKLFQLETSPKRVKQSMKHAKTLLTNSIQPSPMELQDLTTWQELK
jgi:hypothetical protein